jgi:hypothetical protein
VGGAKANHQQIPVLSLSRARLQPRRKEIPKALDHPFPNFFHPPCVPSPIALPCRRRIT